jgi:hypothetical protein
MPYIRFKDVKQWAEGFYLIATHGDQGSAFPTPNRIRRLKDKAC